MRFAFRVDASVQIGSGHVMRCLTLADALRERGGDVLFISREHDGNLNDLISTKGHTLCRLPAPDEQSEVLDWNRHAEWLGVLWQQDAKETLDAIETFAGKCDWLVVDHYALDFQWEEKMRPLAEKIMVIDDLADRQHDCDLLLDQNFCIDQNERYSDLTPKHCEKLLGPAFAMLRPEFLAARNNMRERTGNVKRILVFMGGSDPKNFTGKVLESLTQLNHFCFQVDLVVGKQSPHRQSLKDYCERIPNFQWYENVENMADLMVQADFAIGGGGTTTWERCALQLPTIIVSLAANQSPIAQAIADQGAAVYLGEMDAVDERKLRGAISNFLTSPKIFKQIYRRSGKLVDAAGTRRVVCKMGLTQ